MTSLPVSCPRRLASLRVVVVLVCAIAFTAPTFGQQTLTWDPNGATAGAGGSGTWDTTTAVWTSDGTTFVPWINANLDRAVFGGTAGTVTIGTPITVSSLQFATSGYTLTGTSALTLLSQDTGGTSAGLVRVDAGMTATIAARLAGTVGFEKDDAGTLILSGANTYTGATTISAGTVVLGSNSALGSTAAGTTVGADATLDINGRNIGAELIALDGGTLANSSSADGLVNSLVVGTTGSVTADAGWIRIGNTSGAGSLTFSSTTGRGVFNNVAGGTWAHTGGTILNSGGLDIYGGAAITGGPITINGGSFKTFGTEGRVGDNVAVTVNGGQWQLMESGEIIGSLAGAGGTVRLNAHTLTAGGTNASTTYSGIISGTGGRLIKVGAGTMVLTGANTYTGGTAINGGSVQVANDGNLGAASGSLSLDGGTLATTSTFGTSRTTTLNGGGGTFDVASGTTLTMSGAIGGAGGLVKSNAGTLVLAGVNTYAGGTTIGAGTLQIGNGGTTGTIGTGAVTNHGTLAINRSDILTLDAAVSGTGALAQLGSGTTILTGANTHAGPTTIGSGTLQVGLDGTTGTLGTGAITNNATLAFNRSDALTVANTIGGTGTIVQRGTGTTTLSGTAAASAAIVTAGALLVTGTLTSPVTVASGATLGGTGTIAGTATINAGAALAPGASTGTLTLNGLVFNSGSILQYELGTPNVAGGSNDLVNIDGNLTLNGTTTLNVTDTGTFSTMPGVYRLMNYSGSLSGAGTIEAGTMPVFSGAGEAIIQTAVAGQINLITAVDGVAVQFWDGSNTTANGAVDGGTGTWNDATSNWTSDAGTINPGWTGGFGVFNGAAGTVTLGSGVSAAALQFSTDGYRIESGSQTLTLTGLLGAASLVRVDTDVTATIAAPIAGTHGLRKADAGTLVLTGTNTYSGGTTIDGGTLQIGNGGTTGSIAGNILNDGILKLDRSDTLTLDGVISGTGSLTQAGSGTTILTGDNSYTGLTTIGAGTLQLGSGGTTGGIAGNVVNDGTLAFNRSNTTVFTGAITGTGGVAQMGPGTTVLAAANTYTGQTNVTSGTLRVGDGGTAGTLGAGTVNISSGATLVFDRSDAVTIANDVAGSGTIDHQGTGTTTVSGTVAAAHTTATAGTLLVTGTLTSPTVAAASGSTLGGTGTILGATTIASGATLAPGTTGAGTLTTGSLTFDAGSSLSFDLGTANTIGTANDLLTVNGNLAINGTTLDVGDAGSFATLPGVYRLINYSGTLTGGANLTLGTIPGHAHGEALLQTAVANQVNLIATGGPNGVLVTFWDGAGAGDDGVIAGGNGTWNQSLGNWTSANGEVSHGWAPGLAVFQGAAGTVTLGEHVTARGLQFTTSGYIVDGNSHAIELAAMPQSSTALARVDAGVTATINAALTGAAGLTKADAGTLILTGANTYAGGTTITGGTLQIGNGGITGSIAGDVVNGGTLAFNRSDTMTFSGRITGTGDLRHAGTGTTVLTGTNSYSGTTTITAGTLQVGDGGTTGALGAGSVVNHGTLTFDRSDAIFIGNSIEGSGALVQAGTGITTLNGQVSAGTARVDNGSFFVNGTLTAPTVSTAAGAALGGSGTISGAVTIAAGATLAPGGSGGAAGALTTGSLTLAHGALLAFDLAAPDAPGSPHNDRVNVMGDLTLGGTLNISDAGSFASVPGSYRLISYTGSLTGTAADVTLGPTPGHHPSDVFVQTTVANHVNLIVTRPDLPIAFWDGGGASDDGRIDGGSGTWDAGGPRWSNVNGSINQGWIPGMAIFDGAAGTITLGANTQVKALQFLTDGYSIVGGSTLTLLGMPDGTASVVRVDAGATATIATSVAGTTGLLKLDRGTLVLAAANTYTGSTTIGAGTLLVNGSVAGAVLVAGGATLGGHGSILGTVTVGSGGILAPGQSAGTLTVGSLNLDHGSILNYELDTPNVVGGVNDLIVVTGDLSLAGTINITALDGFGLGTYRLMNYGGALTDNGLMFGALPAAYGYQLMTTAPGHVNLDVVALTPDSTQHWDGTHTVGNGIVDGGAGAWSNTLTNWTNEDGTANQVWGEQLAVFGGTAGEVTVVGPVRFTGLQFVSSGYSLIAGSNGSLNTATAHTAVRLDPGVVATIGVPIKGTGGIDIHGAGTLVLTADNGYTGGTRISSDSILQLGNGGTSGSIVGNVLNDGMLLFNRSDVTGFAGEISGHGSLHQVGAGTLFLTGANTYTGGTTIHSGTISISSDTNLGAAFGPLTINAGTLEVTADFRSARPTIIAGPRGTIDTTNTTTFELSGTVEGPGALVKSGDGTLVLSGANAYAGGTFIGSGTLSVSADANLGAPLGAIMFSGGTLRTTADMMTGRSMNLASAGTIETTNGSLFLNQGIVSGGALTKRGDGLLLLAAANTYAGGTTIADGALQLGNCGTAGSIVGDVRNDGALIFSRADTTTFAGAISGSGSVVKNCTGTTILTGANTYAGGTLVTSGTLQGDTGSLQGAIVDNALLVFAQEEAGTFEGALFGTGSMTKTGAGTLRLGGHHGLQGLTTVQAGTLVLNGTLAGAVQVSRGATFAVAGAVGGTVTVEGAMTIQAAADGGFGELGVLGDVAFRPDAELRVALDSAGGRSALVTGSEAVFAGAAVVVDPLGGNFNRVTHYALVHAAGGLIGTATARSPSPALEPYLSLGANTLFVTLLNTDVPLQPFAVTSNGRNAGGAFDRVRDEATGDLLQVTRQLTALDDAQLGRALDAVAGEIHASAAHLAAMDGESVVDIVRSEISTRITSRPGEEGPLAAQSLWGPSGRRRTWVRLHGERARFESETLVGVDDAHGAQASLTGFVLGIDWSFGENWLAGIGGSYATGTMRLDELDERTEYTAPRAIGYLGYAQRRWGLHAGMSVARATYDTTRSFRFAAIGPTGQPLFGIVDRVAASSPSGPATEVWLDARLNAPFGSWDAEPKAGLRSAWFHLGDWSEAGAGSLSLSAPAQTTRSVQADAGLRVSRAVGRMRPFIEGMYRRELASSGTRIATQFAGAPGGSFDVAGLDFTRDELTAQGGATFVMNRWTVSVLYGLQHARLQTRHSLQLGVGF